MAIRSREEYEKKANFAADIYNRRDYQKALPLFLELAEYNFNNRKVHEVLCLIYLQLKKLAKAEEEFKICLSLQEGSEKIESRSFEDIVRDAGDKKTLEHEFEKMMKDNLKDNLRNTLLPIRLASIYMAESRYDLAEKTVTRYKEKMVAAR